MTLFEYLAVSFSIVLSFAVVRIISGLSDVFARGRVYWVHAAWVIHLLLLVAFVWWNVWNYHNALWNFLTFLSVLVGVALLYYQAATLVPAQPAGVGSWHAHFHAVRPQFFAAAVAWGFVIVFNTSYLLSVPILHPSRISQVGMLVINMVGLSTNHVKVHKWLISLTFILWPIRIWLMLAPGALTSG